MLEQLMSEDIVLTWLRHHPPVAALAATPQPAPPPRGRWAGAGRAACSPSAAQSPGQCLGVVGAVPGAAAAPPHSRPARVQQQENEHQYR
jgi:hypothetical protein